MSRETILRAVGAANQKACATAPSTAPIAPPSTRPRAARQSLESDFTSRLQSCGVIVVHLSTSSDVPAAILRHTESAHLPPLIRHGSDPLIQSLPWNMAPSLHRRMGAASADDQTGVSHALSGIAENGTIVLSSGADNPVTLAFLPELHIVVLEAEKIVATMDDAFALLHGDGNSHPLPRSINLISGASRTGDIGGRLVMGAHGPRQLVALIIADPRNQNGTR